MKLNKKMIIMLSSIVGVIVVLIIVLMLFVGGGNKVIGYDKIEEKMLAAAEKYFVDKKDKLPESGTTFVDVDTLVKSGYLSELSTYTEKEVSCDGKVFVTKTPVGYSYRTSLDCGKNYNTKTLANLLKENVVNSGNGLYESRQVDTNNVENSQNVYVFRGDVSNNYIKVGDYYWRIVKVYENGEIALLGDTSLLRSNWDNRYNIETKDYDGINDYRVSRIREFIESDIVNSSTGFLNIKKLITPHNACIGKRSLDDTSVDGSTECAEILENQYFSLLPMYDYINASLDINCTDLTADSCYNYNYLAAEQIGWWTLTAVDFNNQDVYFVDSIIDYDAAKNSMYARLYVHLDSNVTYVSGTGTYSDPYIVK